MYVQLGFDANDVANYMAKEIDYNAIQKRGLTELFLDLVNTDNAWDHKWQLSALFPSMGLSRRFHHVYKGIDIPYDVWSNIHFGAIGRDCGFFEWMLLHGSNLEQIIHNLKTYCLFKGDSESDQSAIKIGFAIYNEFVKNNKQVNANNVLENIINNTVYKAYFHTGEFQDE